MYICLNRLLGKDSISYYKDLSVEVPTKKYFT